MKWILITVLTLMIIFSCQKDKIDIADSGGVFEVTLLEEGEWDISKVMFREEYIMAKQI